GTPRIPGAAAAAQTSQGVAEDDERSSCPPESVAVPSATETPVAGFARALRPRPAAASPSGPETLSALSDAQLVAISLRGDTAAFDQLYRRHVTFAIHLATRIEGSARDVEDVVHDAFLRAFERLPDLADPGAFRAWLGAIIVHLVRSRMRRVRLMTLLGM